LIVISIVKLKVEKKIKAIGGLREKIEPAVFIGRKSSLPFLLTGGRKNGIG